MKIQIFAFLFQRFQLVSRSEPGNMCLFQSRRMPQLGTMSLPETTHSVDHRALSGVSFSDCHTQVKSCLNSLTAQTNNGWRELLEKKKNQTPDWLTWLCILRIKCSGIFLRFAIQLSQFPLSVLFLLLLPQTCRSETAHFGRHTDGHGPPLPHDGALWLTASPGMWGTVGLVGG